MKRLALIAVSSILALSTLTGCYGKFALTRKIYQVNGQVSDKFLRSGVTWAFVIFPVYGVAAFLDFVLFNTIEFWSGSNPVAQGEKSFQYAEGDRRFDVHAVKEGERLSYRIRQYQNGHFVDQVEIDWNLETRSSRVVRRDYDGVTLWSAAMRDGRVEVAQERTIPAGRPELVASALR